MQNGTVRSLYPLEKKPGVISLLAGKPNPATFPITNIEVTVRAPPDADGSNSTADETLDISGPRLAAGLQYGPTAGYEPFLQWIEGLQKHAHGRTKTEEWSVTVGAGSQDLLYKVRLTHTPPHGLCQERTDPSLTSRLFMLSSILEIVFSSKHLSIREPGSHSLYRGLRPKIEASFLCVRSNIAKSLVIHLSVSDLDPID